MKVRAVIGIGAALFCAAVPALAFQEQRIGGAPAAEQPAAAPATDKAVQPAEMTLSPAEAPKASEGTEVRIPGLGKLGVLPKMDFGLELLYGAPEGEQPAHEPQDDPVTDDLRIKGTLRHNF